jgi:GTP-binding protein
MSGVVAIVGRPNVGKSALFNRIVGRRIAIVHDQPGVTRDRIGAEAEWRAQPFTLIDTGGLGLLLGEKTQDILAAAALRQVELAVEAANVILFVVNLQEGVVPLDLEVAQRLHLTGKPVLVVVNKADSPETESGLPEFASLGFPSLFPVSAIHDRGIPPLLDAASALLPAPSPTTSAPPPAPLKLAVVGRPNVGKSSLVNALTHSDRVIVSPIPGTTRDSVDVPFTVTTDGASQPCVLIDTAGLRKTRSVDDSIEFFSVKRAELAIHRADLVLFVLDAEAGILEQDKKIADLIVAARKACILVVNKWDLFADSVREAQHKIRRQPRQAQHHASANPPSSLAEFGNWVQEKLFFLDYAPVLFTSATASLNLDRLLEAIRYVTAQLDQRVPTAILNRTLQDAIERRQPVSKSGAHLKFFYATQTGSRPPIFRLFVNRDELFSPPYAKFLTGVLRKAFGFEGCPLLLIPKARPKTIEPHHNRKRGNPGRPPATPPHRRTSKKP